MSLESRGRLLEQLNKRVSGTTLTSGPGSHSPSLPITAKIKLGTGEEWPFAFTPEDAGKEALT